MADRHENTALALRPRRTMALLAAVPAVVLLANACRPSWLIHPNPSFGGQVFRIVDLNGEANLPALYTMLLFEIAAVLLLANWHLDRHRPGRTWWRHGGWLLLAAAFAFLGFDEAAQVHERFGTLTERLLGHLGGWLLFAWVIPYGLAVAVLAATLVPFLAGLPGDSRGRFLLAGAVYVGGAVGCEVLGAGYISSGHFADDRPASVRLLGWLVCLEETMEMAGLIAFGGALLRHLALHQGCEQVRFAASAAEAVSVPISDLHDSSRRVPPQRQRLHARAS